MEFLKIFYKAFSVIIKRKKQENYTIYIVNRIN